MKFLTPLAALLSVASAGITRPRLAANERRELVTTAHFVMHAAAASYNLTVPADGSVVPTNSDLNVNIIDANDFDAYSSCTFNTETPTTIVQSIDTTTGEQHLILGPPAVITGVSCHGFCVSTYGDCYDIHGQPVGPCCNGYCAADKCRPWNDF